MTKTLAKRQQQLLNFLQGNQALQASDIKDHILDQGGIDIGTRLGIYKNAYMIRLVETIDTDHPVLGSYLGDDLYDQMVEQYIKQHPSHNYSLRNFSDQLPHFLTQQPPFNQHPQIAELARFERLLLTAFDAPDAKRIKPQDLQDLPTDLWPEMRLRFHPSVQLFQSDWNVVELWKAIKAIQTPPEPLNQIQNWLVWRNEEQLTEFRALDLPSLCLFMTFQQGHSFSQACETLLQHLAPETISSEALAILIRWIDHGILHDIISD